MPMRCPFVNGPAGVTTVVNWIAALFVTLTSCSTEVTSARCVATPIPCAISEMSPLMLLRAAKDPKLQTNTPASFEQVPWLKLADTKDIEAGNGSRKTRLFAVEGPAFETVTNICRLAPTSAGSG